MFDLVPVGPSVSASTLYPRRERFVIHHLYYHARVSGIGKMHEGQSMVMVCHSAFSTLNPGSHPHFRALITVIW